jgi:hypothetical protein
MLCHPPLNLMAVRESGEISALVVSDGKREYVPNLRNPDFRRLTGCEYVPIMGKIGTYSRCNSLGLALCSRLIGAKGSNGYAGCA